MVFVTDKMIRPAELTVHILELHQVLLPLDDYTLTHNSGRRTFSIYLDPADLGLAGHVAGTDVTR